MYFMLACQAPFGMQPALLTYDPDDMGGGVLRGWKSCKRFAKMPPQPIEVLIDVGESGQLLELYDATIAIMSKRLADALLAAGVSNIDFYDVVVADMETGMRHESHVAFNIVGAVSAADLSRSNFNAPDGPLISVDFDGLTIDSHRPRDALFFRLAESVNGIVVHEKIKKAIAAAGIDTVSLLRPEEWVG